MGNNKHCFGALTHKSRVATSHEWHIQSVINTEEIPFDTDGVLIASDTMEFKSMRILRNITHGVNIAPVIDMA